MRARLAYAMMVMAAVSAWALIVYALFTSAGCSVDLPC